MRAHSPYEGSEPWPSNSGVHVTAQRRHGPRPAGTQHRDVGEEHRRHDSHEDRCLDRLSVQAPGNRITRQTLGDVVHQHTGADAEQDATDGSRHCEKQGLDREYQHDLASLHAKRLEHGNLFKPAPRRHQHGVDDADPTDDDRHQPHDPKEFLEALSPVHRVLLHIGHRLGRDQGSKPLLQSKLDCVSLSGVRGLDVHPAGRHVLGFDARAGGRTIHHREVGEESATECWVLCVIRDDSGHGVDMRPAVAEDHTDGAADPEV